MKTAAIKIFRNSRMVKQACLLWVALSCLSARASHEQGSSRLNFSAYNVPANYMTYLEDNKFQVINTNLANQSLIGFFDHSYQNSLILGIDRTQTALGAIAASLPNQVFRAEVDVQLNYNPIPCSGGVFSQGAPVSVNKTLKVSFSGFNAHTNVSAPTTETDIDTYHFLNGYQATAIITAVRIYNQSNVLVAGPNVPANIYLELQYDAERYYNMGATAYASNADVQVQYLSGASTGNEIELKWKRVPGAEEYELEWLWLDEFTYGNGAVPANTYWNTFPELNFRNNSTRIRTDQNTYRISNVYQSGHLFFRLRAVGNCYAPASLVALGNPLFSEYYTAWTWPDVQNIPATAPVGAGVPPVGGGISGLATVPFFIDLRALAHEDDKNWVYTAAFAEDGKKKEVISYFDGSQHNRQSVTKNNSDNKAVVAETYYDFVGRAAIQALPTPVNNATIKLYQQTISGQTAFNFNTASPPNAYTKNIFAAGSGLCAVNAPGFNSLYGTGEYYSANNPFLALNYNNGYAPKGEDYPFTQTEYTADNTGKVARQSIPGTTLKIEHNPVLPKHDTRHLYGSVSQEELDRLFGSEAGYASHYSKSVTVDANGQVSISYMNQEGKVVATALGGTATGALDPLLKTDGTDLSTTSNNIQVDLLNKLNASDPDSPLDKNDYNGGELIFNEKIVVTTPQTYQFDYTLASSTCFNGCSGFCYDCVYDLEFDIKDACDNRPVGFTPITYSLGTIIPGNPPTSSAPLNSTGGNNPVNFSFQQIMNPGPSLAVALDVGEYVVYKKLKVNQEALAWYLKDYLTNCADNAADFDAAEAVNLNVSGCELDCKECADKLGSQATFTTNYLAASPGASIQEAIDQYNLSLKACYEPCSYDSYCEVAMEGMMEDMKPGGQYAEFNSQAGFSASSFPLSIFNLNNSLPRRTNLAVENWRSPVHYKTAATSYVDEFGAPDKVTVTEISPGVYSPPILPGSVLTAIPNNATQFLVSPERLTNAFDFVINFKPSWGQSLLIYHPEYCYIEWCLKNGTQQGTNFTIATKDVDSQGNYLGTYVNATIRTSDDFDSLYTAVDDIDDIENVNTTSYSRLFDPLNYDPYWTTTGYYWIAGTANNPVSPPPIMVTLPNPAENIAASGNVQQRQSTSSALPADFVGNATMYPAQKTNKTANNRFLNYLGTGLTLFEYAAFMSTPLAQQYGQSLAALLTQLKSPTYYPTLTQPQINAMTPTDKNWILLIKKPGSAPTDDSYKRKAWETYKTGYLAMKQVLQQEAAQSYVMNAGCRGCNECIGNAAFDETSVKYTTYSSQVFAQLIFSYNASFASFPANISGIINLLNAIYSIQPKDWYKYPSGNYANNKDQACGLATKNLYINKTKRFYMAEDALALLPNGGNNVQASIFAQTGLCPNAYDLQNFLNGMVSTGYSLNATSYNLNANVPEFTQNLYESVQPTIPTPFVNAFYNFSNVTGPTLNANISIATAVPANCAFALTMPNSVVSPIPANITNWALYAWQGATPPTYTINQFGGLQPTSSLAFNIVATVSGPGSVTYTVQLSGSTACIALTGCSFLPPCAANGTGKALNSLLNTFASNGAFPAPYNGSYQTGNLLSTPPSPPPYAYAFLNTFKPLLETTPSSGWAWNYTSVSASLKEILISDGNNANKRLKIEFTTPFTFIPAAGVNPTPVPDISCIQVFQNFVPDPSTPGGFLADGVISNINNITACPSGTLRVKGVLSLGTYVGSSYVYSPMNVGTCSFELATCNTNEHEAKRDLAAWVTGAGSGFATMANSGTALDVSNQVLLSPLLRSYLNSAVISNINGPQQNYYYWLPDGLNTNNNQVKGWLCVSQSASAPGSPPAGSCDLTIKKITSGGTSVSSLLSGGTGSIFKLAGNFISGNLYSFKIFPTGGGLNDTLLATTSCFPMKDCESCNSTTTFANSGATFTTIIQDFTCGSTGFNLYDENDVQKSVACRSGGGTITNALAGLFGPSTMANFTQISVSGGANCGSPNCNNTWSSNSGVFTNTGVGNKLVFSNNATCPGNNCCPAPNRQTTYSQQFNVTVPAYYDFFIPQVVLNPGNYYCSSSTALNETMKIYVDNVLVKTVSYQSLFNGGNNPFVYITPIASIPFGLGFGNHNLKLVFSNNNLSSLWQVHGPLGIMKTGDLTTSLPCANTPWPLDTMPTTEYENPCAQYLEDVVDNTADEKFEAYLTLEKNKFIHDYIEHCMSSAVENLAMTYNNTDYHFTLYYYDQAGNLSRTVPPEGTKPIDLGASYAGAQTYGEAIKEDRANYYTPGYPKKVYTAHKFLTTYTYNSLNQLVQQQTPDAGISKFYYDNLGRLVASQNAEQNFQSVPPQNVNPQNYTYSYTRYDALGRINQVGKLNTFELDNYPIIPTGQTIRDVLSDPNYPFNLVMPVQPSEVTQTYYGDDPNFSSLIPGSAFASGGQQYLRGRVAATTIEENYDGSDISYDHGSHYSYDIHGNVEELVQDNPDMTKFTYFYQQNFKRTEYTYDLVSGKVNSVIYQRGQPDMLMHKYGYDADNRITNVYTSRDGLLWDQDAKYYYYLHGPLSRSELGEHKVQSSDHAYTLQGWIKGVNNEALKADNDMGKDGYSTLTGASNSYNLNRFNARDGYAYAINYYSDAFTGDNDYLPVNTANSTPASYFLGTLSNAAALPSLYNGNISFLSACYLNPSPSGIALTSLASPVTVNKYDPYCFMRSFKYDQLNRLMNTSMYAKAIDGSNNWMYTNTPNLNSEFHEEFTYDQNGNILGAQRSLISGQFDQLTYHYYDDQGTAYNPVTTPPTINLTNKLAYVTDPSGSSLGDIGNQPLNNYSYDKNGNLTADAAENIQDIEWTVYGKIKRIIPSSPAKPLIEFKYDASGNRVSKKITYSSGAIVATYYVRDAQGNVMSVYTENTNGNTSYLYHSEQHLYGNSRLGLLNANATLGYVLNGVSSLVTGMTSVPENKRTLGLKSYEMGNHLGNVLAAMSDRKLPVDNNANNVADYFVPDIVSANDYFVFGAPMPGRQFNNGNYRYGFNGKENDNEVKGTGNQQDYGMRIYDPRIGKFLSVDPLSKEYPWNSTYAFAENDVIRSRDLDGAEKDIVTVYLDESGTQLGQPTFETLPKPGPLGDGTLTKYEQLKRYQGGNGSATYFAPSGQQYMPDLVVSPTLWQNVTTKTSQLANAATRAIQGNMSNYGEGENLINSVNAGIKGGVEFNKYSIEIEAGIYSGQENYGGTYISATFNVGGKGSTEGSNLLNFNSPSPSLVLFGKANTGNPFHDPVIKNDTKLTLGGTVKAAGPINLTGSTETSLKDGSSNTSFGIEGGFGSTPKLEGGVINSTTIFKASDQKKLSGN